MSHPIARGKAVLAVCGLTAATVVPLAASSPAQASPYCGITWGSTAKVAARATTDTVHGIRAGQHSCYDRVVVDLGGTGASTGYRVRYVGAVSGPSGVAIPLAGAADLQVDLGARAYTSGGTPTIRLKDNRNAVDVSGFRTLRQIAYVASFEGHTTMGIGVRARLPMRVFVIQDPGGQRLVIDVAHRW